MKIAHVVCVYPPYKGGIGNVCKNFAEGLVDSGHEVVVFTPDYQKYNNQKDKIKVTRLKTFGKLGNGAFIPSLILKLNNFDIIHLHYPFFGGIEAVWLFKLLNKKKKVIIHYHMDVHGLGVFAKILSIPSKLISGSLFSLADAVTCASIDYLKESSINNIYQKYRGKFHEIPFGVDIKNFYPVEKKTHDIKRILFVGGLDKAHYFKGVDILFDALSMLPKQRNDWILDIVGSGDLENDYKEKSRILNLENKVSFFNKVEDDLLPSFYQKADVLVLPSINSNEAFGLVLLEAMSSGISVIASDLPGVRKVFDDGKQGFFVKPKDAGDLKEKMTMLLDNDDLRSKMGMEGRILAEKKYAWKVVIKKLEDLYEDMLNK